MNYLLAFTPYIVIASIMGFIVYLNLMTKQKNIFADIFIAFLCGPIAWIFFIMTSLSYCVYRIHKFLNKI